MASTGSGPQGKAHGLIPERTVGTDDGSAIYVWKRALTHEPYERDAPHYELHTPEKKETKIRREGDDREEDIYGNVEIKGYSTEKALTNAHQGTPRDHGPNTGTN